MTLMKNLHAECEKGKENISTRGLAAYPVGTGSYPPAASTLRTVTVVLLPPRACVASVRFSPFLDLFLFCLDCQP